MLTRSCASFEEDNLIIKLDRLTLDQFAKLSEFIASKLNKDPAFDEKFVNENRDIFTEFCRIKSCSPSSKGPRDTESNMNVVLEVATHSAVSGPDNNSLPLPAKRLYFMFNSIGLFPSIYDIDRSSEND